jgi:hypothetical protein
VSAFKNQKIQRRVTKDIQNKLMNELAALSEMKSVYRPRKHPGSWYVTSMEPYDNREPSATISSIPPPFVHIAEKSNDSEDTPRFMEIWIPFLGLKIVFLLCLAAIGLAK